MKYLTLVLLTLGLTTAHAAVTKGSYGTTRDGQPVERYVLTNQNGLVAKVITVGGIITELHVPDRNGKLPTSRSASIRSPNTRNTTAPSTSAASPAASPTASPEASSTSTGKPTPSTCIRTPRFTSTADSADSAK